MSEPVSSSMRLSGQPGLLRSTLWVYGAALATQVVAFAVQLTVARAFGAGMEMDAFVAANTLPQYIIEVLSGSLGAALIPVFVQYGRRSGEAVAWEAARGLLNQCLLFTSVLALSGMFLAPSLLRWTVPGLQGPAHHLATGLAMVMWPTLIAMGASALLTGLYQAKGIFAWPALVPLLGTLLQLGMILLLVPRFGIMGLAVAATTAVGAQAVCLLGVFRGRGYSLSLQLNHPAVREVWRMMLPLFVGGLVIRWTPLIERFLASSLAEGSMAHLNYAFRLLVLLSMLMAVGLPTTLFPRLATNTAEMNLPALRQNISMGLRWLWLLVAPAIALGMALALPMVSAVLQRGQFTAEDSRAVAELLVLYLPALAGMMLGGITGKVFCALKAVRIPAVAGIVEAVAYAAYTWLFSRMWGAAGIALGYACYFVLSAAWQLPVIWCLAGRAGGLRTVLSFLRTCVSAAGAGGVACLVTACVGGVWRPLFLGSAAGVLTYGLLLYLLRAEELHVLGGMFRDAVIRRVFPSKR